MAEKGGRTRRKRRKKKKKEEKVKKKRKEKKRNATRVSHEKSKSESNRQFPRMLGSN